MSEKETNKRPGLVFFIFSLTIFFVVGVLTLRFGFDNQNGSSNWIPIVLLFSTIINLFMYIKRRQKYYIMGLSIIIMGIFIYLILPMFM